MISLILIPLGIWYIYLLIFNVFFNIFLYFVTFDNDVNVEITVKFMFFVRETSQLSYYVFNYLHTYILWQKNSYLKKIKINK